MAAEKAKQRVSVKLVTMAVMEFLGLEFGVVWSKSLSMRA